MPDRIVVDRFVIDAVVGTGDAGIPTTPIDVGRRIDNTAEAWCERAGRGTCTR